MPSSRETFGTKVFRATIWAIVWALVLVVPGCVYWVIR